MNEKTSDAEMDDIYELVMLARTDNKLWKSGLDSSYKTFIANKPSPNMKAVLLSILWTVNCLWYQLSICSYQTIVINIVNSELILCDICAAT